jgi:hypothetical protein
MGVGDRHFSVPLRWATRRSPLSIPMPFGNLYVLTKRFNSNDCGSRCCEEFFFQPSCDGSCELKFKHSHDIQIPADDVRADVSAKSATCCNLAVEIGAEVIL